MRGVFQRWNPSVPLYSDSSFAILFPWTQIIFLIFKNIIPLSIFYNLYIDLCMFKQIQICDYKLLILSFYISNIFTIFALLSVKDCRWRRDNFKQCRAGGVTPTFLLYFTIKYFYYFCDVTLTGRDNFKPVTSPYFDMDFSGAMN